MKFVPASVTRTLARSVLKTKKNSPHIFFALGVAGTITSTVLACRATMKLDQELDEIKNDIDNMKEQKVAIEQSQAVTQSEQEYGRDLVYVYGKASGKLIRLYAPAAIVGVASIACLTGSHIQMTRRNSALMAAYAAVQNAYNNYRARVREEYGVDRELDIYHAARNETVTNELGKKSEVKIADPDKWSPYAKFFDEGSKNFVKNAEYNMMFIRAQQTWANQELIRRGHLFLNQVYDVLGFDDTQEGSVVGWIYNSDVGDNYVSFGMGTENNERFINGLERVALLDFNVDGVIYDKI